jgi:prepilin-type N-terminal cleavage/methylation domain-containing protein
MKTTLTNKRSNAFSLIELLMVLTIISIMAALIINAFTNASQDSRDVIARQQQAVLKSALDNMMSQFMVGGATGLEGSKTVTEARKYYTFVNGASGTKRTMKQRLALIEAYLDDDTYAHFLETSTDTKITSAAMVKTNQYIEFEEWVPGTKANRNTYPKVKLSSE